MPLYPPRLGLRATVGRDAPAALAIYRPMRPAARLASQLAARLIARGVAIPRSEPLEGLEELMSAVGLSPRALVHIRSSHGDRRLIAVAESGALSAVVKIGPADDPDLRREAEVVEKVGRRDGLVSAPRLLWRGSWRGMFVLVTEGVPAPAGSAAAPFDRIVELCAAMTRGIEGIGPIVHGDLNPSNVLPAGPGFVLVDWEWARFERDPMFDLAHYAVGRALARRSRAAVVVGQLTEQGSPGWRYLEAIGADPADASALLHSYLQRGFFTGTRGRHLRMAMWAELGRRRGR